MALWAIRHLTTYGYSVAVRLAPHVLRLTPREGHARILTRRLSISPEPVQWLEEVDAFGNACTRVLFDSSSSQQLRVESYLELETSVAAATSFVAPPRLPWTAPGAELSAFTGAVPHPEVLAFAQSLAAQVGYDAPAFLHFLARELCTRTERQLRVDGAAQAPELTLSSRRGACRDLSVLYLAACRSLGMAGRFVSGYQGYEQSVDGRGHLHAWAEIWIPEQGFVGWDPMQGAAVGPGHIALAAAPEQANTMPIEGGYYFDGPSVASTLDYVIEMFRR